jgi:hypothetical protein
MGKFVQFVKKYAYDIGYSMENQYFYWWVWKKNRSRSIRIME